MRRRLRGFRVVGIAIVGLLLAAGALAASAGGAALACPSASPSAPLLGCGAHAGSGSGSARLTADSLKIQYQTSPKHAAHKGQKLIFWTNATGGPPPFQYSYSGLPPGCPNGSLGSRVTCVPNQLGNYSTTVVVTDKKGDSASASKMVPVDAQPLKASLSVSPSTISLGQTALYTANATGGTPPYSYTWLNSPPGCFTGPSGLDSQMNCTPAATGSYSGTFVVVNDSAANTQTTNSVTLNVVPALTASLSASPSSIDQGQAVTFSAMTSGGAPPLSYAWSTLPPGCPAPPNAASVHCGSVTSPGAYSVTVTVNDSSGETAQATAGLTVHPAPTVSLSAAPNPVSQGGTTTLTATPTGGTGVNSYAYSGLPPGCTSSNTSSLSCTPSATGTYSIAVSLTDSAGGHATSNTVSLSVVTGLVVSLTASPAHGTDVGKPATFNATASGGTAPYSYSWTGLPTGCVGGNTATVSCTPGATGSFSVTAAVTDSVGGHGTSAALPFFVNATPSVGAHSSPPSGKPPLSVNFTAAATGGTPPFTYTWHFGDGTTNTTSSPTVMHTYTTNGSFTAIVWANDSAGSSAQNSTVVLVSLSGFVVSLVATHSVVDAGQVTNLSAPVNGAATPPYTYSWSGLPPGCASANTSNLSCRPSAAATAARYVVNVTVSTVSNGSATASLPILVNPTLGFGARSLVRYPSACSLTLYLNGTAAGGTVPYSYNWSFGDNSNTANGTPLVSHTYAGPNTYLVTVRVTDGAGNTAVRTASTPVPKAGCPTGGGFGTGFPVAALAVALVLIALVAIVAGLLWLRRQRRRGPPAARAVPGAPSRPLTPAYVPPAGAVYPPPAGAPSAPAPGEPPTEEAPPSIPYDPDRPL